MNGYRRQLRHRCRIAVAAILGATLLLELTACGSSNRSQPDLRRVVAWVNRPLPDYHAPDAKPVRYPTAAPPCRAHDVRVGQGRTGVGLGNRLEEFIFTNAGDLPCILRGYPAVSGQSTTGRRSSVSVRHGGTYFGRLLPAAMAPGGHVYLDYGTANGCGPKGTNLGVTYRHLVFRLPNGGLVRAPTTVSLNVDCGIDMTEFGLPERYAQPRAAPPGSPGTLQARLVVAREARAGSALRYTVILRNPTSKTVSLKPCPGYIEGVYEVSGANLHRSFVLNCDAVQRVPPGAHVRYEMRIMLPSARRGGVAKLGWNLNTPNGPFAGATIQISSTAPAAIEFLRDPLSFCIELHNGRREFRIRLRNSAPSALRVSVAVESGTPLPFVLRGRSHVSILRGFWNGRHGASGCRTTVRWDHSRLLIDLPLAQE